MSLIKILSCAPTVIVSFLFGFIPWGAVVALITLALYAAVLFIPKKTWIRKNVGVALEGLKYGDLNGARDHIEIALREAESSSRIDDLEIASLIDACEKVASALKTAGQNELADSIRKRGDALIYQLTANSNT
jgi:hypothetical protein